MSLKKSLLIGLIIVLSVVSIAIYFLRIPIYCLYTEMLPGDNLFPFELNGKWGYMDKAGKIVIKPQFYGAREFASGRAAVYIKGERIGWGYINAKGKIVIQPTYHVPSNFYEGYAHVASSDEKYINIFGKGVSLPDYIKESKPALENEYKMYRGLKPFQGRNGRYGYKNRMGLVVIQPRFEIAGDFSDEMAGVSKNSKIGFINTRGELVIDYQYENAFPFSDGLSLIQEYNDKRTHFYFINKQGKKVLDIPEKYYNVSSFHNGLAKVGSFEESMYIDKTGKTIEPHY